MVPCPKCGCEVQSTDIACVKCLHVFNPVTVSYSEKDDAAFLGKDGSHFGFPYKKVFATVVDSRGKARFTQKQAKTQLMGIRHFKKENHLCWIWGERFIFTEDRDFPLNLDRADQGSVDTGIWWFLDKFDYEQRERIKDLAKRHHLDPAKRTHGKPDLAIYSPAAAIEWRFVELKRSDELTERQAKWLNVLSQVLGPEAVFVIEFKLGNKAQLRS